VTGPSSSPRGEEAGRPGTTWETELRWTERLIDDDAPTPRPSRSTRRAQKRKKNRHG
jgi:hypothetical protein